ncbi:MAG: hypothetical protein ACI4AM_08100 [Muribaculaceae bacterium]
MATYTSKPVVVGKPAAAVAASFSDLTRFQQVFEQMPAEERAKVGDVSFSADRIAIKTTQVGEIGFKVKQRSDSKVVFAAENSPVPMEIKLDLKALSESECELTTSMEVDIPIFLRPMIGGAMQKAVDQFAALMQKMA